MTKSEPKINSELNVQVNYFCVLVDADTKEEAIELARADINSFPVDNEFTGDQVIESVGGLNENIYSSRSLQFTTILLSTQKPKKKQSHFIIKVTMQIVMLIGRYVL